MTFHRTGGLIRRYVGWLAVPLIAVPAVMLRYPTDPGPLRDGMVTMGAEEFGAKDVTVQRGGVLRMINDSHWLHVIVPGDGAVVRPEPGSPSLGPDDMHVVEHGDVVMFGPWQHLGTYHLTCSLHPEMNLTVHVVA